MYYFKIIGTVTDGDKVWKGKIEIPNLSEEHDAEEVNVSQTLLSENRSGEIFYTVNSV